MKLSLLRHGITTWNLEKRVQGRIDQPLCKLGRDNFAKLVLPATYRQWHWYCSPLLRARQSAELLRLGTVDVEPSLVEMNWGDWEGEILKSLRRRLGAEMRANEDKGIDFCPPGGESPRQVQARLQPWLRRVGGSQIDSAAVVHKGIIRCIYALACHWDMRGESPVDFIWDGLHQFELNADGQLCNRYRCISLTAR